MNDSFWQPILTGYLQKRLDVAEHPEIEPALVKLYLTGGIGCRHINEGFGDPYELPNLTGDCPASRLP